MENSTNIDYAPFLASLEEKLANIEAERIAIEARESALKESIASFRKLIMVESGEIVHTNSDNIIIPKRAFKGLTVFSASLKYLKIAKQWSTVRQIVDGLMEGGIESKSKFLPANVRTELKRQGDQSGIIQVGNLWGLKEWPRPVIQEEMKLIEQLEQEESNGENEG